MRVTEERAGNIQKTKVMASSPGTSWKIEVGKVETVADFIFLDSSITVDGDCSREIKKHLLLGGGGWEAMTHLGSVLKIRDIPLPTCMGVRAGP